MVASRQTKLKLRKGFVAAPISYRVLMVKQFNKEDQKEIARGLIKATTPSKANDLLPTPGKKTKWSIARIATVFGGLDVMALRYKGLEVAIFWKRQTSEVIPEPTDPVPEGVIENADDVWVRFDLFGKSVRQLHGVIQDDMKELHLQLVSKEATIVAYEKQKELDDKLIQSLQAQLASSRTKSAKSK